MNGRPHFKCKYCLWHTQKTLCHKAGQDLGCAFFLSVCKCTEPSLCMETGISGYTWLLCATVPEVRGPGGWRMEPPWRRTLREACSTQLATAQTWQATLCQMQASHGRDTPQKDEKDFNPWTFKSHIKYLILKMVNNSRAFTCSIRGRKLIRLKTPWKNPLGYLKVSSCSLLRLPRKLS